MTMITATGLRDGQPHTVTAEIDDAEIARRKAAVDARRSERENAPDPLVQRITDVLVSAGVVDSARAADVVSTMSGKPVVTSPAAGVLSRQ